jgi:ribonuclease HII
MINLTLGIDDAGRGPVLGSMVLAGAVLTKEQEVLLKKAGVADSKTVLHPKRMELAKLIEANSEGHAVVLLTAKEIDFGLNNGTNLNTLEAQAMAKIINELAKPGMNVIIDCPSVNTVAWRKVLISYVKHPDQLDIKCEHKADVNHVSASAASILAKVRREEEVDKLKKQYGAIGSGYPADPYTQAFLKENGLKLKDSGIFRTTWATWKELFPSEFGPSDKQRKLF